MYDPSTNQLKLITEDLHTRMKNNPRVASLLFQVGDEVIVKGVVMRVDAISPDHLTLSPVRAATRKERKALKHSL